MDVSARADATLARFGANGGSLIANAAFSEDVGFTSSTGSLTLAQSQIYTGKITGFSHAGTTSLDLRDIAFVSSGEATFAGTATGGTLTVTDGTHTAKIKLVGDYRGDSFTARRDGHGGILVLDAGPPAAVQAFVAALATTGPAPAPISASQPHSAPPAHPLAPIGRR